MPSPLFLPPWGPFGYLQPKTPSVRVSHYPAIGPSSVLSGSSLLVRLDRGLLITIEGFDDTSTHVDLDSQRFFSKDETIFTVGPNPNDPLNRNQALITPVSLGVATLAIRSDGDPNSNNAPLALDLTITVYAAAVSFLLTYAIPPDGRPIAVPFGAFFEMSMNQTALLRVQGLDAFQSLAALSDQLFNASLTDKFTLEATTDPGAVLVHPVAPGSRGIDISADGDGLGPEVVPLATSIIVTVKPSVATHMVASAATVIP
jgi:hypothetical protein